MEDNPFPELKIDSPFFLDDIKGRSLCPKCGKSRKFYCYSCYVPLGGPQFESKVPKIKLPVKVDVIKHPLEVDGKSTAVHAGILSAEDVTIYTYPTIPEYTHRDRVLLVFPGADSLTFEDYVTSRCSPVLPSEEIPNSTETAPEFSPRNLTQASDRAKSATGCVGASAGDGTAVVAGSGDMKTCGNTSENCAVGAGDGADGIAEQSNDPISPEAVRLPKKRASQTDHEWNGKREKTEIEKPPGKDRYQPNFDRVIFIDSTWHAVNKISSDDRLAGIQKIELKTQKTKFWRYQLDKPDTYLSTIEAIYYFLREYHDYFHPEPYAGQFDNLLFYFVFMYDKIRLMYEGGKKLKAYGNPKKS